MKLLKQTIMGVAVLSLSAGLFTSCNTKSSEHSKSTPPQYLEQPAKIISIKQAKNMYDIYTNRKVSALKLGATNEELNIEVDGSIATDANFKPTRYIEYRLEEIKHYIAYIENEARLANVEIGNLRIYLGAYPLTQATFESGEPARYNRQESLFILPTTLNKENGKQQGFYTSAEADGGKRYAEFLMNGVEELHTIDGTRKRKGKRLGMKVSEAAMFRFSAIQDADDRSLVLNDGNVVPPPDQDTDMGGNANNNGKN